HLPHDLVNAFRSTLQETAEAQLLLHVIDSADENRDANIEEVEKVLSQIDADEIPCIQVMNKVDLTGVKPRVDYADDGSVKRIWLSVESGNGLDYLKQTLIDLFREKMVEGKLSLLPGEARLRAKLFDIGAIRDETIDEEGRFLLKISISRRDLNQFESREQVPLESMLS
ncbi:MAG: GTPase HflX, partial [Gammaproteobacteria bacterium]|nr:GTPase HflX [Gammaproteobacteria bacterium]